MNTIFNLCCDIIHKLSDIILTIADDLFTGCIIAEREKIDTPEKRQWYMRYCEMMPAGIVSR